MTTDAFDQSKKIIDSIMYAVIASVPEKDWEDISCSLIFEDRSSYKTENTYTKNEKVTWFTVGNTLSSDLVWPLEKFYYSEEKGRLKKAVFKINSKGKFNIDFEYETK